MEPLHSCGSSYIYCSSVSVTTLRVSPSMISAVYPGQVIRTTFLWQASMKFLIRPASSALAVEPKVLVVAFIVTFTASFRRPSRAACSSSVPVLVTDAEFKERDSPQETPFMVTGQSEYVTEVSEVVDIALVVSYEIQHAR